MTINTAFKKAQQNGYVMPEVFVKDLCLWHQSWANGKTGVPGNCFCFEAQVPKEIKYIILLDPLFWQALGKAMGWSDNTCNDCGREIKSGTEKIGSGEFNGYHCGCGFQTQPMAVIKGWLYHWHRMIDALSERKSIEQYFESLYEK